MATLKFSASAPRAFAGNTPDTGSRLTVSQAVYAASSTAGTQTVKDVTFATATGAATFSVPKFSVTVRIAGDVPVFTSNNPGVATVDQNGNVTPIANGVLDISISTKTGGFRYKQQLQSSASAVLGNPISPLPTFALPSLLSHLVAASNAVTASVLPGASSQQYWTYPGNVMTANASCFIRRTVGAWTQPANIDYLLSNVGPYGGTPVSAKHAVTIGHGSDIGQYLTTDYYPTVTGNTTIWTAAPSAGGVSSTVAADTFVPDASRLAGGTPVMYRKPGEHYWRKDPATGQLYAYAVQGATYQAAFGTNGPVADGSISYDPQAAYSFAAKVLPTTYARYLPTASPTCPIPAWVLRFNPQSNGGNFTGSVSGSTLTVTAVSAGQVSPGSLLYPGPQSAPYYAAGVPLNGALITGSASGTTLTVASVQGGSIAIGQVLYVGGSLVVDGSNVPITVTGGSGNTWTLSGTVSSYGAARTIPAGTSMVLGYTIKGQLTTGATPTYALWGAMQSAVSAGTSIAGSGYTPLGIQQVEPVDIIGLADPGPIFDQPNRYTTSPLLDANRANLSTGQIWHGGDSGSVMFLNIQGDFVLLGRTNSGGQSAEVFHGGAIGVPVIEALMNKMASDWNADRVKAAFSAFSGIAADAAAGSYALSKVDLSAFQTF